MAEVDFVDGWAMLNGKCYLNWAFEVRDEFLDEQAKRKVNAHKNWSDFHIGILDGSVALYTHEEGDVDIAHPQHP